MEGKGCCSGTGCIVGLFVLLIAVAYLVYSYEPLQVVYQPDDTAATVKQAQHRQEEGPLRSPHLPGIPQDSDR